LYRVAVNQCRSLLRSQRGSGENVSNDPVDPAPNPGEGAAQRDESERLKRAVERLSPPLRETVLLCYTHGLTHTEAAEAMDIPVGTVKSRLHAALTELRTVMSTDQ